MKEKNLDIAGKLRMNQGFKGFKRILEPSV